MLARAFPEHLTRLFLWLVPLVLGGYAVLGPTFAGLGVPPLYIGDLLLGIGLLTLVGAGAWFWCIFAHGLALAVGGEQRAAYARAESQAAVLRQRQNATV